MQATRHIENQERLVYFQHYRPNFCGKDPYPRYGRASMPKGKQDAFMLSDRLQQGFKKTIAIYSFLIQSVLKQMDIKIIAEDSEKPWVRHSCCLSEAMGTKMKRLRKFQYRCFLNSDDKELEVPCLSVLQNLQDRTRRTKTVKNVFNQT